jgi:hypothetical protein
LYVPLTCFDLPPEPAPLGRIKQALPSSRNSIASYPQSGPENLLPTMLLALSLQAVVMSAVQTSKIPCRVFILLLALGQNLPYRQSKKGGPKAAM